MGEARQMLARRLGDQRAAAEPGALDDLVTLCARLPLALAIAAARAADRAGFPLTALTAEMRSADSRLDAVSTGEDRSDLRAMLSLSYGQLAPAAARIFRLLGLHPGPDISIPGAGSLAGLPGSQAGEALAQLARASLTCEHAPGRYAFHHDLLRAYAAEQACAIDSETDRRTAFGRMLDHYLHNTVAAARLYNPSLHLRPLTQPQPGVILESLADHQQAVEWLDAELQVLSNVVRVAAGAPGACAWQLPRAMSDFLDRREHWKEAVVIHRTALTAAIRLGDEGAQAVANRLLATACARLGGPRDCDSPNLSSQPGAAGPGHLVDSGKSGRGRLRN
jgi:hypothetical protein